MLSNWLDPSSSSEFAFACSTIGYNQFSELAIPVSDYNPYFTGSIYILNVLCLFSACAACAVSSFCYTTRPTLGNILILLLKSPSWKKFHIWRSKTHYWRFQTLSLIVTKKKKHDFRSWLDGKSAGKLYIWVSNKNGLKPRSFRAIGAEKRRGTNPQGVHAIVLRRGSLTLVPFNLKGGKTELET
jgi:hypothetical protein